MAKLSPEQAAKLRAEKLATYDPNAAGQKNGHLYGLPFGYEESGLVILNAPWEVTVSYGTGTAAAPQAILDASPQIDLHLTEAPDLWQRGIYLNRPIEGLLELSESLRPHAEAHIHTLEQGLEIVPSRLARINEDCGQMVQKVKAAAQQLIADGKIPALLGGDHSTPLGLFQAQAEVYPIFGILQIDAHCDLREGFEGFKFSHASVMYNALEISQLTRLVQVGIRDFCREEADLIKASAGRIHCYEMEALRSAQFTGAYWHAQCKAIVASLPQHVHISFDIDGLEPSLCPSTGTPVPGGLRWEEAQHLLDVLLASGREIIGFDLVEVGTATEWDAVVGCRMLYRLATAALASKA
jgi:agmatinase